MKIPKNGSHRLSSRYPFATAILSLGKDMFGIDVSKMIPPQVSPTDKQAQGLETYGPHTVSNTGKTISWIAE